MDETAKGLSLIGWYRDSRSTSEDQLLLDRLAGEVLDHDSAGTLNETQLTKLSFRAFDILYSCLLDPGERAALVTFHYAESASLRPDCPLVDESILAYYRGYYAAALSLGFGVLERYLRSLSGWTKTDPKPSFSNLISAVERLPSSDWREISSRTLKVAYEWYRTTEPPPLQFNRHGVHHGLRGRTELDRMNFARLLGLFDSLVAAETGGLRRGFVANPAFEMRLDTYKHCVALGSEQALLDSEV
jgi:hypothetical protein